MARRRAGCLRGILLAGSIVLALLVSRLLTWLFAADPTHPFVQVIRALTAPLVWPLAWLDAAQPTYGVRFERGTLVLVLIVLLALITGAVMLRRRQR